MSRPMRNISYKFTELSKNEVKESKKGRGYIKCNLVQPRFYESKELCADVCSFDQLSDEELQLNGLVTEGL